MDKQVTVKNKKRHTRMDELQRIQLRRQELSDEMARSRARMLGGCHKLMEKEEIPSGIRGKASFLLSKSDTIINGLRMGYRIGKIANALVKLKKSFSKKKKQTEGITTE